MLAAGSLQIWPFSKYSFESGPVATPGLGFRHRRVAVTSLLVGRQARRDAVKTNTLTIVVIVMLALLCVGSGAFLLGQQWQSLSREPVTAGQTPGLGAFRPILVLLGAAAAAVFAGTLVVIVRLRRTSA